MATLKIVEGNTRPINTFELNRGGSDINLSDVATVNLIIFYQTSQTVTNTGHQECVVTDEATGEITYTPQTGDFPGPGNYIADVELIYDDGGTEILHEQLKWNARPKINNE